MKILSALLDPKWDCGIVSFDGAEHIFLKLHHPDHPGGIVSLIPRAEAQNLGQMLVDLANGKRR